MDERKGENNLASRLGSFTRKHALDTLASFAAQIGEAFPLHSEAEPPRLKPAHLVAHGEA